MTILRRGVVFGGVALVAAATGSALRAAIRPVEPARALPVCRAGVRVVDAAGGTSADLTGERAEFDLLENLGLLEGHLIIGRALLEANMSADALPHFGHPVHEIFEYLRPQMARRQVADFEPELVALETQARRGAGPDLVARYDAVIARVEALRATVPAELRASERFMTGVIAQLMQDVADDYEEAIERGRIANAVEYHDALGFLTYIERLTAARARAATGAAIAAYAVMAGEIRTARAAFPALRPPVEPPVTAAILRGHAARIADVGKDL